MDRAGRKAIAHRDAFRPLVIALVVLAWATLFVWERSPYGRYLDHGQWDAPGFGAVICRALPQGDIVVPLLVYASGWVLMIGAMMLPTTLPLVEVFRRLTRDRADRARLAAILVAGYLAAWSGFGLAAHLLDRGLFAVAERSIWLQINGWIFGAAVLLLAGAFQFSALKYRCLEMCHTPFSFVAARWRGQRPAAEAFGLGWHHGVFCVGCCWALMLLMFVVGTGSVGWMLALGAVMAIEKNMPWGRGLSAPLGAALIVWSCAIVAVHAI
jgi:predicted metal-binding membrane protein